MTAPFPPELAAWNPSNLIMPQYGKRYCIGCERQRTAEAGQRHVRDWRCPECREAGR